MFSSGSGSNPFEASQIIDLEPTLNPQTQQVGWEYFAPKLGTLSEMLEAIAEAKRLVEQSAEQAMGHYVQRRQIRDGAAAEAQIHDSEILEMCPQASAELGRYRADAEAATHQGVREMLQGNREFRL
jgi:hypothetical protein